jgi:hypothetical protein
MRYDHGRENLEQNAVNFLGYDEERSRQSSVGPRNEKPEGT